MKNGLLLLALGVGGYLLYKNSGRDNTIDVTAERTWLLNWNSQQNGGDTYFGQLVQSTFSANELDTVFHYISDYWSKGVDLTAAANASLYNALNAISTKYNIF